MCILRIHRITQHHSALVLSCMTNSSSTAIRTDLPAYKSTHSANRKTITNEIQICKCKQGAAMLMQFFSASVSGFPEQEDSLDNAKNMLCFAAD